MPYDIKTKHQKILDYVTNISNRDKVVHVNVDPETFQSYWINPDGTIVKLAESSISRVGMPVADIAELTAIDAVEYEHRIIDTVERVEYIFTTNYTADEATNPDNVQDNNATGYWIKVTATNVSLVKEPVTNLIELAAIVDPTDHELRQVLNDGDNYVAYTFFVSADAVPADAVADVNGTGYWVNTNATNKEDIAAILTTLGAHQLQIDANETSNTAQDTKISNIETKNTTQDTRLTAVETKDTAQDTKISNIETKNTEQDTRLTAVETKDTVQDGRLTAIETKDVEQDNRLTINEANNSTQDTRLDGIDTVNTAQDNRLNVVEAKNTVQDGKLTAIETKNTAQDNRLTTNEDDIVQLGHNRDILPGQDAAKSVVRIHNPKGGALDLPNNYYVGYVRIALPKSAWSNTMVSMDVAVYSYLTNVNTVIRISAYVRGSEVISTTAAVTFGAVVEPFKVHFGKKFLADGSTAPAFYIESGDVNNRFRFGKVYVTNLNLGYYGADNQDYVTEGLTLDYTTTIDYAVDVRAILPNANSSKMLNNVPASGYSLIDHVHNIDMLESDSTSPSFVKNKERYDTFKKTGVLNPNPDFISELDWTDIISANKVAYTKYGGNDSGFITANKTNTLTSDGYSFVRPDEITIINAAFKLRTTPDVNSVRLYLGLAPYDIDNNRVNYYQCHNAISSTGALPARDGTVHKLEITRPLASSGTRFVYFIDPGDFIKVDVAVYRCFRFFKDNGNGKLTYTSNTREYTHLGYSRWTAIYTSVISLNDALLITDKARWVEDTGQMVNGLPEKRMKITADLQTSFVPGDVFVNTAVGSTYMYLRYGDFISAPNQDDMSYMSTKALSMDICKNAGMTEMERLGTVKYKPLLLTLYRLNKTSGTVESTVDDGSTMEIHHFSINKLESLKIPLVPTRATLTPANDIVATRLPPYYKDLYNVDSVIVFIATTSLNNDTNVDVQNAIAISADRLNTANGIWKIISTKIGTSTSDALVMYDKLTGELKLKSDQDIQLISAEIVLDTLY